MTKKKNTGLTIFIIILICLFALPLAVNLTRGNEEDPKKEVMGGVGLSIVESEIEYAENSITIDVLSGYVTTNVELDKIFVNVNGIGVQELTYEKVHTQEGGKTYVVHTIAAQKNLCATVFGMDADVTAVLYVEYEGMTYKVSEDTVAVKSCWIGPY